MRNNFSKYYVIYAEPMTLLRKQNAVKSYCFRKRIRFPFQSFVFHAFCLYFLSGITNFYIFLLTIEFNPVQSMWYRKTKENDKEDMKIITIMKTKYIIYNITYEGWIEKTKSTNNSSAENKWMITFTKNNMS